MSLMGHTTRTSDGFTHSASPGPSCRICVPPRAASQGTLPGLALASGETPRETLKPPTQKHSFSQSELLL